MSTRQLGEDEIERRLRLLSAHLDPAAPRGIYAYIRGLPDEHPVRRRRWANPMRTALGRSGVGVAVCVSLALVAVIGLGVMPWRSVAPAASPTGTSPSNTAPASASPSSEPSSTPTLSASPGGPFTPTGALPEYRLGYSATLLLDGRVLIAGGFADGPDLTLAELYDPATGTFSPTGSMTIGREYPTATLLQDGRVLFVGGDGEPIDTAELYDPATGKFSRTGSPIEGRRFHSATLLKDGRVLIAGGPDTTAAELYDPTTGKFTRTGSLKAIRYFHTATLLADGRVLIVGGRTANPHEVDVASAEIYDPETGRFSSTGSLAVPREGHTATLLPDGRVLVAGGSDVAVGTPALDNLSGPVPRSAELYDPATARFSPTGSMTTGRANHGAVPLKDGSVLIVGGQTNRVELYDPATGTFREIGKLLHWYGAESATPLTDGRVLLLGGSDLWGSGPPTAELYEP